MMCAFDRPSITWQTTRHTNVHLISQGTQETSDRYRIKDMLVTVPDLGFDKRSYAPSVWGVQNTRWTRNDFRTVDGDTE